MCVCFITWRLLLKDNMFLGAKYSSDASCASERPLYFFSPGLIINIYWFVFRLAVALSLCARQDAMQTKKMLGFLRAHEAEDHPPRRTDVCCSPGNPT